MQPTTHGIKYFVCRSPHTLYVRRIAWFQWSELRIPRYPYFQQESIRRFRYNCFFKPLRSAFHHRFSPGHQSCVWYKRQMWISKSPLGWYSRYVWKIKNLHQSFTTNSNSEIDDLQLWSSRQSWTHCNIESTVCNIKVQSCYIVKVRTTSNRFDCTLKSI